MKFKVKVTRHLLRDLAAATADNHLMDDDEEDVRQLEAEILAVLWRHRLPKPRPLSPIERKRQAARGGDA